MYALKWFSSEPGRTKCMAIWGIFMAILAITKRIGNEIFWHEIEYTGSGIVCYVRRGVLLQNWMFCSDLLTSVLAIKKRREEILWVLNEKRLAFAGWGGILMFYFFRFSKSNSNLMNNGNDYREPHIYVLRLQAWKMVSRYLHWTELSRPCVRWISVSLIDCFIYYKIFPEWETVYFHRPAVIGHFNSIAGKG